MYRSTLGTPVFLLLMRLFGYSVSRICLEILQSFGAFALTWGVTSSRSLSLMVQGLR